MRVNKKLPSKKSILYFLWLSSLLLFSVNISHNFAGAQTAPVTYSANVSPNAVKPGEVFEVTLSFSNSVEIAGASINFVRSNNTFSSFESSNSSQLSFVTYYPEFEDVLFICNNNSCSPGTYEIAKLRFIAGSSGASNVTFNPKETADPSLQNISAQGTQILVSVSQEAPPSPVSENNNSPNTPSNTFTVPQDDSSGGFAPDRVTEEELVNRISESEGPLSRINNSGQGNSPDQDENTQSWSLVTFGLLGLGIGVVIGALILLASRLRGKKSNLESNTDSTENIIKPEE